MVAFKLKAAQFGGSRLCGGPGAGPRLLERQMSADELLAKGPVGGPGGPQELRHKRVLANKDKLLETSFFAEMEPEALCAALSDAQANPSENSAKTLSYAQGRLAGVVLGKVQNKFLETSLSPSRSDLRRERLPQLCSQLDWASKFRPYCGPAAQAEFSQLALDTEALVGEQKAKALQRDADSLEEARRRRKIEESPMMRRRAPKAGLARQSQSLTDLRSQAARPDSASEQNRIVREAMAMLRRWRSHSEVSLSLCQTLLRLVQGGDEAYKDKLQQQGLGVLATTVADMHQDRPQVVRLALRLLGVCSPQLLLDMMRESLEVQGASQTVRIGLEVLNWLTQLSAESVDEIARLGGREIISQAQPAFASDKMVTLQCLNLRRRLTKSKVRSLFKPTPKEVDASAEEVLRLRGCFEALDQDGGGFIDADELGLAFKMMGMKMSKPDLEKSLKEVDIDGSGQLEWPEFLSLMAKYGKGQSIEGSFTAERLAELKEIFSVFDADGSGSLEVKELDVVFRSLGLRSTEKEIRAMVKEVDADDSGTIDWHEFLYLMSKKIVNPRDQSLLSWEFFTGSKDTEQPLEKDVFVEKMQLLSQDFTVEQLNDMIFQAKFENSDLESITFLEFQRLIMRR